MPGSGTRGVSVSQPTAESSLTGVCAYTRAVAAAARCCSLACSQREIEGEILLTVRKFYSSASVSPDGLAYMSDESEEEEPTGPIDHATEPMQPIPEPMPDMSRGGQVPLM